MKKRATKTIRLDATILNQNLDHEPASIRLDERILPAPKPTLADLPVSDLLNALRDTGGRDGGALLELQHRYDHSIERALRKYSIRDWHDRQSLSSDVWQKVIKVATLPADARGAWNPARARHAADPFRPLLNRIVRSKAIDFHRKAKRQKLRFTAFTDDVARFGNDASALAETSRAARRRLLDCVNPSKAPQPISGPLNRRLAAATTPSTLAAAVDALPGSLGRPLLLHAEGSTCAAIAAAEGISRGEACKRLKEARVRLGAMLAAKPKAG